MKQIFSNGKLTIQPDENDPKDKLKVIVKKYKGKELTDADKVKLFDAFLNAGIIKF